MLAILTFLASGPGGALLGLLIKFWDKRSEDKLRQREIEASERVGLAKERTNYMAQIHKGTEGVLKEVKRDFKIWFIHLQWTKWKAFSSTTYSPFSKIIGICLCMFVATICLSIGIMLLEPWWNYYSLSPEGQSSSGSIGIGPISLFKWTGDPTKPVALNAGGAAFYLLAAINFTATTAIVGTTGRSRK
jgi:hypothetical protein